MNEPSSCPRGLRRRSLAGVTLTEIVLAAAILGACGVALLGSISTGVRGTARAGELELGCTMAAKLVDRLVAAGYPILARVVGSERILDLSILEEPQDTPPPDSRVIVVDGVTYSALYSVEQSRPGLLRVTVTLGWQRYDTGKTPHPGLLRVVRYVADPVLTLATR